MTQGPVKFLLVDDVEENLVALEALLRRDGLELLKARSGAEAERFIANQARWSEAEVSLPRLPERLEAPREASRVQALCRCRIVHCARLLRAPAALE